MSISEKLIVLEGKILIPKEDKELLTKELEDSFIVFFTPNEPLIIVNLIAEHDIFKISDIFRKYFPRWRFDLSTNEVLFH